MSRRAGALQLGVRFAMCSNIGDGLLEELRPLPGGGFSYDPFRAAALQYESIVYIYQCVSRIVRVAVISA
jgi:hypothetical protein